MCFRTLKGVLAGKYLLLSRVDANNISDGGLAVKLMKTVLE